MKKTAAKIIFDILLTAIWVILMLYSVTGALMHEVLGVSCLALFAVHVGYNIPMLKRTSHNMFKHGHGKQTFMYLLDIFLGVFILLTTVSGILISKEILTSIEANDIALWTWIHEIAAYAALVIMSIHIGLHWSMITSVISRPFKKLSSSPAVRRTGKVAWNLIAVAVMVYGLIATVNYHLPALPSQDTSSSGNSSENSYNNDQNNNNSYSDTNTNGSSYSYDETSTPSLEEYLGNLVCTGCGRHCSLLSPQCGRGEQQAAAAEEKYTAKYGSSSSDNNSGSSSDNGSSSSDNNSGSSSDNGSGSSSDNGSSSNDNGSGSSSDNNSGSSSSDSENTWNDNGSGSVAASSTKQESGVDVVSIMGLYIGGTFYTTKLTRKRKKNKSDDKYLMH